VTGGKGRYRKGREEKEGEGRKGKGECDPGPAGRQVSGATHWKKTGLPLDAP